MHEISDNQSITSRLANCRRVSPVTFGSVLVVVSVYISYLARLALEPAIRERMPYTLFIAAVAASTRWAGPTACPEAAEAS